MPLGMDENTPQEWQRKRVHMAPESSSENIYDLPKKVAQGENIYNLANKLDRPDSRASLYGLDLKTNNNKYLVSNERHK